MRGHSLRYFLVRSLRFRVMTFMLKSDYRIFLSFTMVMSDKAIIVA